jgi:hypothetical protein
MDLHGKSLADGGHGGQRDLRITLFDWGFGGQEKKELKVQTSTVNA